jgi:DNA-binding MarR family transcriptional regulator
MEQAGQKGSEALTLLEVVLQLHGGFRRGLESIRVTLLQVGALLFLRRDAEANMTNAATALRVTPPTLSDVVKDLVRKQWITKRRSVTDTRVVHLRLGRQGAVLAQHIQQRVPQVEAALTEEDHRISLGMRLNGRRD